MDELGTTKIAAAILSTALGIMVIGMVTDKLTHKDYPAVPAYTVGPVETVETGDAEPLPFPQADWVAAMDAERGAKVFKKCSSCHNVEAGGAHTTGPALYNTVGTKPGQKDGFAYSGAMSGMEVDWSYEELDKFLTKPSKYLSGTKMSFIGLKKAEDRSAVIEYLRIAAENPLPRPEPVSAEPVEMVQEMTEEVIEEIVEETGEQKDLTQEKIDELK